MHCYLVSRSHCLGYLDSELVFWFAQRNLRFVMHRISLVEAIWLGTYIVSWRSGWYKELATTSCIVISLVEAIVLGTWTVSWCSGSHETCGSLQLRVDGGQQ